MKMFFLLPRQFAMAASLALLLAKPAMAQRSAAGPLVLLYASATQMPRLPNGASDAAAIETAIRQHLVYQPQRALQDYDRGIVTFTIGPEGQVRDARVLPSETGPDFDKALLAAVGQLPRFSPGLEEGQAVPVRYTITVGAGVPNRYNLEPASGIRMPPDWPDVQKWVPTPPRLVGGEQVEAALMKRVKYPDAPLDEQNPPMLWLYFTVDKTGRIVDLLTSNSAGLAYDRAAVQALRQLPRFEPGRNGDGEPVPVRLEHSVTFVPRMPAAATATKAAVVAHPAPAPAQATPVGIDQRVYTYVERMPQLLTGGGNRAVEEAIKQRLVIAHKDSKECKGSKLQVQFTVDATGAVKDEHIERGLTAACNEAVLAAVRKLPAFSPGVQNGHKVAVRLIIPVLF